MIELSKFYQNRNYQFWALQLVGWTGWVALFAIRDAYWGQPFERILLLAVDAVAGLILTTILRYVYRAVWDRPVYQRILTILIASYLVASIWQPIKNYSSGMAMRLGFSVAVHTTPDIMLIDEILSVGDTRFRIKCKEKMREIREQGRTFVFVTHSVDEVVNMCERTLVIWNGRIEFDGPSQEAADFYCDLSARESSGNAVRPQLSLVG